MITLFGATGYTGRRIARQLDQAGRPFRVAGRSPKKLAALSESLPSRPPFLTADVQHPDTLPALFRETRVLVNCAGPFIDLGEPVLSRAAAGGVHYLDLTNELSYVYRMRQYDALARKTGAAVVPACAFEVAISDCVIAQMARKAEPLDSVHVLYGYTNPRGVISYGTRLSGLRTFATSWMTYRGGKWAGQMPGASARRVVIEGRAYHAITFPSSEVVTVPAHCTVRDVQAWLAVSSRWAYGLAALMPLASVALRTPLGRLAALSFQRLAPPPPESSHEDFRFLIQIEVKNAEGTHTRVLRGDDPYELTAAIAAYAAGVMSADDYQRAGVLAPSLALAPDAFVEWLTEKQGVRVSGG